MGQHGEAGHVAGGIDIGNIGAHLLVHFHAAGLAAAVQQHVHAQGLQAEAGDVGTTAHAHQDLVPAHAADLSFRIFIDHGIAFDARHLAAQAERHALLCIDALEHRADFVVHRTEDFREHLHHGHLGADGIEEAGELHADHAAADDDQFLGLLLQGEDFAVGYDYVAGLFQTGDGRNHRLAARAEQQVAGRIVIALAGEGDAVGSAALDASFAFDGLDPGGLHAGFDAADEFLDHLVLAGDNLGKIERSAVHAYAVLVCVAGIVKDFGAVEQRLGGDAALVQAHTAHFPFLEEDDRKALRTGALGGDISAGTSSDNG